MKVDGLTTSVPNLLQTRTRPQAQQQPEPVQIQQNTDDIPESTPELENSQSSQVKGVIQNLLDGHYKGVADVRLRINHYEELKAIEDQQLKAAVGPEVSDLLTAIQDAVNNIPELNQPLGPDELSEADGPAATISGLYSGFGDSVNGLVEQFKSGQITSTGNLIDGIKNAFADFIASLQNLLVPQTDEISPTVNDTVEVPNSEEPGQPSPTEEIPPIQTEQPDLTENTITDTPLTDETQPAVLEPQDDSSPLQGTEPDYATLINGLQDVFSTQIADLTTALVGNQVLPELSDPSGNGAAYKKFLAIYNELWSIQPSDNASIDILNI